MIIISVDFVIALGSLFYEEFRSWKNIEKITIVSTTQADWLA